MGGAAGRRKAEAALTDTARASVSRPDDTFDVKKVAGFDPHSAARRTGFGLQHAAGWQMQPGLRLEVFATLVKSRIVKTTPSPLLVPPKSSPTDSPAEGTGFEPSVPP